MPNAQFEAIVNQVRELVAGLSADGRSIRVLEAGCGSGRKTHVVVPPQSSNYIVGLDISQDVLDKNDVVKEKILADIQSYVLQPRDFDLIVCFDVLEHLPRPEKALANFARGINDGGLIVIASPVVSSVKSLMTKLTPYWFHVFAYRYLLGNKDAGKPGNGPFPTFLRWSISPARLMRFARDRGLKVEYLQQYHGQMWDRIIKSKKALGISVRLFGRVIEILTLGRITAEITDFIIVLRKEAQKPL
jgi:SAM-dependent methyltransferase